MADPVLICGAGLSGLLFAQGLRKHNIPFRLFERDSSLYARSQGYRIRVSDTGVHALQNNLSTEHFRLFQQSCCAQDVAATKVPGPALNAKTAKPEGFLFGPGQNAPAKERQTVLSVDRGSARTVLSLGLEEYLDLGKEVERFVEDEFGVLLTFRDGSSVRGSALVAADGAWSKIRRQKLPEFRLADSQGRLLFGKTELSEEIRQQACEEVLSGLTTILASDHKCLFEAMHFDHSQQHAPADYIYWVLFLCHGIDLPDDELRSLDSTETLRLAQKLTEEWHPGFRCIFDSKSAHAGPYQMVTCRPSALPLGQENEKSRVVLIGDAAHPMPPTAALGGSTALTDAHVLLDCFLENDAQKPRESFRKFETKMVEYATKALELSAVGGKAVFGMKPFDELPALAMI